MFASRLDPAEQGGIGIAFTDRLDGYSAGELSSFNLGRTDEDQLSALQANMAALRTQLGVEAVAAVHQVHGVEVYDVDAHRLSWLSDQWLGDRVLGQPALPRADALITTQAGLALMVRAADCLPVLFAAGEVIAAAHAGRVGLLAGVLNRTVQAIRERTKLPIQAWVGPHICGRCYEVPSEMADQVALSYPQAVSQTSWGTPSVDLGQAAQLMLTERGVTVTRLDPCTKESERLFSHRGDGPATGRQAGLIWRI